MRQNVFCPFRLNGWRRKLFLPELIALQIDPRMCATGADGENAHSNNFRFFVHVEHEPSCGVKLHVGYTRKT